MSEQKLVIPAGGTVRCIVWNYEDDDEYKTDFDIIGDKEWVRPVVGLIFKPTYEGPPDPLTAGKDGGYLNAYPLVVDQYGSVFEVHDYLHSLLGGQHWDCATHFFQPHIHGPVTDAPRIRRRAAVSDT